MNRYVLLFTLIFSVFLSGCTDWIYRIDVPQGNFLNDRDLEELRIGMTKEQVIFVLGRPVVQDSFDHDTWYYVYDMKRGMKKRGESFQREFVVNFEDGKVVEAVGDFELPESFYEPIE